MVIMNYLKRETILMTMKIQRVLKCLRCHKIAIISISRAIARFWWIFKKTTKKRAFKRGQFIMFKDFPQLNLSQPEGNNHRLKHRHLEDKSTMILLNAWLKPIVEILSKLILETSPEKDLSLLLQNCQSYIENILRRLLKIN